MALVTLTGRVGDHSRNPAGAEQELLFRPRKPQIVASIMQAGVESITTPSSQGAFSIEVEGNTWYTPVLRWLTDSSQSSLAPEKRAYGYEEWPDVYSGDGGPIGTLPQNPIQINGVWYGYGPPPEWVAGALYVDISGVKPVFYGPANGGI